MDEQNKVTVFGFKDLERLKLYASCYTTLNYKHLHTMVIESSSSKGLMKPAEMLPQEI